MILRYECSDCRGTGLYSGMCEAVGEAVICVRCYGKGVAQFQYTPFTGRKGKRGIKKVSVSQGTFIGTGVGAVDGTSMTYAEFQKKIPST